MSQHLIRCDVTSLLARDATRGGVNDLAPMRHSDSETRLAWCMRRVVISAGKVTAFLSCPTTILKFVSEELRTVLLSNSMKTLFKPVLYALSKF